MDTISQKVVNNAMTYAEYRELTTQLLAQNKTTGENHSEAMIHYTELNETRMKRLDKTTKLLPEVVEQIQAIDKPLTWLVLTEAWCGDAAQIIPVLEKMASENEHIDLKLILRDENLDIMDAFLTNGGRSIPKVIFLEKESLNVLGSWGPRPAEMQQMVMDNKQKMLQLETKEEKKAFFDEVKKEVQLWYAHDKTRSTQLEMLQALKTALKEVPVNK